jgi:uncharacterized protein YggE
MKYLPTILNILLCCVLGLILATVSLPNATVRAVDLPTATAQPTPDAKPDCDPTRTIQVSGSASVKVVPDRALIQLGVQSNAASVGVVRAANDGAVKKLLLALNAAGVQSKDISTDRYSIQPIYREYDDLTIKGYRINNMVAVTLRDVDKTSAVIAAALEAGANQVHNVEFYTSELRKYRDQARDLAAKAAQEKARALAQGMGTQTGCVVRISEDSWSYYNNWWYGREQNLWTQNTVQNAAPSNNAGNTGVVDDDGPVSLGQISVQAKVDVTYALK